MLGTWTRADLVKYLGRVLSRTGRDQVLDRIAGRDLDMELAD
jgi:hypothetical protein